MRPRWVSLLWVMCLTTGLVVLCQAALWTFSEWRFRAGLKLAKADIDAKRFGSAGEWLAAQSASRPDHAEAAFLLGICENATGHHEAAVSAWTRVPLESPWGLDAAIARTNTLVDDLGRWADAEAVITAALVHVRLRAPQFRYFLIQLFYREGRLDEMHRLLQEGWNTSSEKAGDLRDVWLIGSTVVMVDQIRAAVEQAARKAPDDDCVWLARANVALLPGLF